MLPNEQRDKCVGSFALSSLFGLIAPAGNTAVRLGQQNQFSLGGGNV